MKKLIGMLLSSLLIVFLIATATAVTVRVGGTTLTSGAPAINGISVSGTSLTIDSCVTPINGYVVVTSPTSICTGIYAEGITDVIFNGISTISVSTASDTDLLCAMYLSGIGTVSFSGSGSATFTVTTPSKNITETMVISNASLEVTGCKIKCIAPDAITVSTGIAMMNGNITVHSGAKLEGHSGRVASGTSMGVALQGGHKLTLENGCSFLATSPDGMAISADTTSSTAPMVASINQSGNSLVLYDEAQQSTYRYVATGTIPTVSYGGYEVVPSVKTADIGWIIYMTMGILSLGTCIVLKKKSIFQ